MGTADETPRVGILGAQLRDARKSIGLSLAQAARGVGVSPEQLQDWEADETAPPVERLWELAELYCRGFDYFLRRTPPPPENVRFRVARARAMRDLSLEARKVLARFEELCRAQTELEELLEERGPAFIPTLPQRVNPDALAEGERVRLDLGDRPIKDLRFLLEAQGVRVFELGVPNDEFAGFSWRHREYGPGILVNAGDALPRRRWTLAHEYFHVIASEAAHVCDLESVGSSDERLAQRFAASFLMPPEAFLSYWAVRAPQGQRLEWDHIVPVARRYGVSLDAAAIRLAELGAASREEIDRLLRVKAEPRPSYGRTRPRFERELGQRYLALALEAYSRGRISLGRLAEYLGVTAQRALQAAQARAANGGM